MAPTQELIDAIYRSKVLRARAMSPEEKVSDSLRLFEMGCEITKAGIRAQHPDADEVEVLRILKDRLALARRLEGPR
jgi:Rv0078B-related antitoxin